MSRIMRKSLRAAVLAFLVPCCLALAACGGGGAALDTPKVLKESELYNPVTNPSGVVEQPGQTVALALQVNASDLPPMQSADGKGVEDLWFEVTDAQAMQFALDADTQAPVERVEIRDAANTLRATLTAALPTVTLTLDKGLYQALVYASSVATAPMPVFVQYGAATSSIQGAQLPGRVQAQAQYTINIDLSPRENLKSTPYMLMTYKCVQCNLQGHSVSNWYVVGRDLRSSNFTDVSLPWAKFDLAPLMNSNFSAAKLMNASFVGSNLSSANFTGANLTGAQFTNADLSNAIWVDGVKRCAPGSIGACR